MPQPVDLRGLDPPEPLLRILSALESGAPGPLVFLLAREPWPLYPMLTGTPWRHSTHASDEGVVLTLDQAIRRSTRDP